MRKDTPFIYTDQVRKCSFILGNRSLERCVKGEVTKQLRFKMDDEDNELKELVSKIVNKIQGDIEV